MISMDKTYLTEDGRNVRLLCTDSGNPDYPVVGLVGSILLSWDEDGMHNINNEYNLVEVGPYHDFLIDEQVMVRDTETAAWNRRHFAGVVDGWPTTFFGGKTSWSKSDHKQMRWVFCRRPTAEELECV